VNDRRMLPETPQPKSTTTERSGKDRQSYRFGLRALFASVAAISVILFVVRHNRGIVGSGWSAIREGSPFRSQEFYVDAATELQAWLREKGFSPRDTPKLAFTRSFNAVWYEKIVDGSPIRVCIVVSRQHLEVEVECFLQAWPFQYADGLPAELKNSCGGYQVAIGEWWREYNSKHRL